MGAVLALPGCAASLACCFGSAACSLCCNACPSCANSTTTRIMYAILLLVGTITSCIMLAPSLQKKLGEGIFKKACEQLNLDCEKGVGYLGVYRICFAMVAFFLLMCVIMIGVKTSKDGRAKIQNGFWFFKYLIVIGICVGAFYFPPPFGSVWMYFGLIGAFLFILIQLILIIDFVHGWAARWQTNADDGNSKGWFAAMLTASLLMFGLSIALAVIGYVYYTHSTDGSGDSCTLHKFFISFNLVLCVLMSIVSVLPAIQDKLPHSGLLQASAVSAYVMFMTWSAMANDSNQSCTWDYSRVIMSESGKGSGIPIPANIVGMFIFWGCVLYSSIRSSSHTSLGKITGGSDGKAVDGSLRYEQPHESASPATDDVEAADKDKPRVIDVEEEGVSYNYSFFHFMFAIASLYIMMSLTNWVKPVGSDSKSFNSNPASMWVKIVSSWICVAIYMWSLVAPLVLANRDFN